jgi:hypothetical protein
LATGEGDGIERAVTRRYQLGEEALQVPDGWTVSAVVSVPAAKGEFVPNLVVTHDRLRPEETFATYIARQLVDLAKHLRQFKLHGRRDLEVGGRAAHEVACAWMGERGPLEQRITIIPKDGGIVTFTATMPKAKVEGLSPVFESIVSSAEI